MASATLQQAPEAPEKVNSFGRIIGVIFSPKATFQSIARRPTWLIPVILLCLAECVVVGVYGQRVGWRSMLEKQLANNSQFQQLPAQAQQDRITSIMGYVSKIAYAEVIIGPFLAAFALAGIFWLIFNMGAGAKIGYKVSLAVVSYALVPGILGSLLGVLIIYLKDPSTVDLQHLLASNVGAFSRPMRLRRSWPRYVPSTSSSFGKCSFWPSVSARLRRKNSRLAARSRGFSDCGLSS